jgi:hypothetical protein
MANRKRPTPKWGSPQGGARQNVPPSRFGRPGRYGIMEGGLKPGGLMRGKKGKKK